MGLLTAEERREFLLQTKAQEGEEVVSANEVNTDAEDEPISSPPQRRERPRGRHESRPRKRRRTHEVVVSEERIRRAVLIKLRSSNSRARSKMKARRLILEADSSTESRAAASRGRPTPKAGAEVNMVREKEATVEKDLRTSEMRTTPVVLSRAMTKEKSKAIMMETRAKVLATSVAAPKEWQYKETESKYEVLLKKLAKEVKKRRYLEKACESLREDVEKVKCATLDLLSRLEASQTAYNAEL
ncbi:hypothetical protein AXG93_4670s1000 [Marchantia polymorpha subsp. ruderalis]|uniref:Uncharacterized protein n=1 Tax=Marchantia polymorpha subsp. ruderalis TaxID=1480154 RepID=A0A176VRD8_MARPO|nr:hypothetical protein AXG93_4670s1000 [Marchantia polymorpha subsp. ruderalis]